MLIVLLGVTLSTRSKAHSKSKLHQKSKAHSKSKKRIFVNRRLATVDSMNRMNRFKKEVKVNMTIVKRS